MDMHSIRRTSPKGEAFIGYCVKCGEQGLSIKDMDKPCANLRSTTQDEDLIEAVREDEIECVILWRNTQNGSVGFISDDTGELEVFASFDAAQELASEHHLLRAFPYQIVKLEDL